MLCFYLAGVAVYRSTFGASVLNHWGPDSQSDSQTGPDPTRPRQSQWVGRTKHAESLQLLTWKRQLVIGPLGRAWVGRLWVVRRRSRSGHRERVLFSLHVKLVSRLLHQSARLQRDRAVLRFLCIQTLCIVEIAHNRAEFSDVHNTADALYNATKWILIH